MSREKKYPCKNCYTKIYDSLFGGEWWAEWSFHPDRKWRFDYALPDLKIAIEVDGGVFTGGRHSGGVGQVKDMEKCNHAASLGWLVFHIIPDEMYDMQFRKLVQNAIEMRKSAEK